MTLLERTLRRIEPQSREHRRQAEERILDLTMPRWALGRVLDLAVDLAGMTRSLAPAVKQKNIVLMAGDHGIIEEGVSEQPQAVTLQMVYNFIGRGAGINVLARNAGANVTVVDMGINHSVQDLADAGKIIDKKIAYGTKNFAKGPAMTRDQAVAAIEAGIEVAYNLSPCTDIFGTGEMGICNTSPSSAIIAVFTGVEDVAELVDRGAGLPAAKLPHKAAVIRKAIEINRPDPNDGIDVLAKVGGFEIGGLAGLILGAAALKKPVVVDGFISTAGALIAAALCPDAKEYMIAAHGSMEKGHRPMLELLGKKPLLDLDLRLGEGTGAALAMNIVDAAAAVMTEMATFSQAGVTVTGIKEKEND
ncbi:MAG: nicotinate-nucleotide--dimethylbenzimidazole phosphoribosyltransferase [Victivallaceae bacterium]|nr:nicotinate-nucleotide--dimethylbenzimidazole phosphoribosyltransferase [Victivallaceae bacterium]